MKPGPSGPAAAVGSGSEKSENSPICVACHEAMLPPVSYSMLHMTSVAVAERSAVACTGLEGHLTMCCGCTSDWWSAIHRSELEVTEALGQGVRAPLWPVCPFRGCKAYMPEVRRSAADKALCQVVPRDDVSLPDIAAASHLPTEFRDDDEIITRCPSATCANVVRLTAIPTERYQGVCPCGISIFIATSYIAEYRAARSAHPLLNPAEIIDLLYTSQFTACPRCRSLCELESGCNHVTCPLANCRFEFNIRCGCRWKSRWPAEFCGYHQDPWSFNACPRLPLPVPRAVWLQYRPRLWRLLVSLYRWGQPLVAIFLLLMVVAIVGLAGWASTKGFLALWQTAPAAPPQIFTRTLARELPPSFPVAAITSQLEVSVCGDIWWPLWLRERCQAHMCDWAAAELNDLNAKKFTHRSAQQDIDEHRGRVDWSSKLAYLKDSDNPVQLCTRVFCLN